MTLATLRYHRPASLAEACRLGHELGADAVFLAGGTELLPPLSNGQSLAAQHLISLRDVAELRGVSREADGTLHMGAMTRLAELTRNPLVAQACLPLAEIARCMAGEQVRQLATVGGNVCAAVSCADLAPVCLVSEARLTVHDHAGAARQLELSDLIRGPRQTALAPGELVTAIDIPPQPLGSGSSMQRFSLRRGNALAVASVAVRVTLEGTRISGVRLALGAVAATPRLVPAVAEVLLGAEPDAARIEAAAAVAYQAAEPISDVRASAEFRRELVQRLAIRALQVALERARSAPGVHA